MKAKKQVIKKDLKWLGLGTLATATMTGLGRIINQSLPTEWFKTGTGELYYINASLSSQLVYDAFFGAVYLAVALLIPMILARIGLRYFETKGDNE